MLRPHLLVLPAALALAASACGPDTPPPHGWRVDFLLGLELNGNRAFGMTFTSDNDLVVSGTAHNKRPAVARLSGEVWTEIDVPEQMWLERLPSGEIVGIGTTKLFSLGRNASSVKEIGEINPNPKTAINQSTARVAGDGSIWFMFDTGRFQRIPAGGTTAVPVPVPDGTNADTALPGSYARTGDGRMFAGVRGAGIYEVSASGAEMMVPCSDPEIDDCNGGDIIVVDSYGPAPLFRRGTLGGKVYRLDLEFRRLRLVADIATLEGRILTSVADAPNGDVYIAVQRSAQPDEGGNLLRVRAGTDPPQLEQVTDDFIVGPASLTVRNDSLVFLNAGLLVQYVH